MAQPFVRFAAGGGPAILDPATLALSGWYRGSYASAPWAGTASAGTSGAKTLQTAGADPLVGTKLGGYAPARMVGSYYLRDTVATVEQYVSATAYRVVALVNVTSFDLAVATPYLNRCIWSDGGNAYVGVRIGASGVSLFHWQISALGYAETPMVPISLGWHVVDVSYDGTTLSLSVDGGTPSTIAAATMVAPTGDTLMVGCSYNGAAGYRFPGELEEIIFAQTDLASVTPADFVAYFNDRYGLTLGGAFSLRNLGGLTSWHRADLGVTIGTGVSAWADQSGVGDTNRNATQGTGSKQPTVNASNASYANQPTLHFASASAQLLVTSPWSSPLASPFDVWAVGNYDGGGAPQGYFGNNTGSAVEGSINNGGTNVVAYAGSFLQSGLAGSASPVVLGISFGTGGGIFVSSRAPVAEGTTGTSSLSDLAFGSDQGGPGHPLNGDIAELFTFDHALRASERRQVTDYLAARYAISVPAFVPTQLPGCMLWLRADLGVTSSGGAVSAWADQGLSGDTNRNATGTGATKPALNASDAGFAGHPSISFSGSQLMLTGTWSAAIAQPCTVWAVCREDTGTKYLCDSINPAVSLSVQDIGGPDLRNYAGAYSLPPAGFAVGVNGVVAAVFSNALSKTRNRWNSNTAGAANAGGTNGAAGVTLGNYAGGGAYAGWTIAEFCVFDHDLTDAEIDTLNDYAAQRYGLGIAS